MSMEWKQRDCITIKNLKIFAYHGVFPEEKQNGQEFLVSARLYLDIHTPGKSDRLEDALNYAEVSHFINRIFTEKSYDLIEAASENLCMRILLEYTQLQEVEIEVHKPQAPIGLPFEDVSVTMNRGWHRVYLSFGSNMGDSRKLIQEGIETIEKHPWVRGVKVSDLLVTKPYGPVEQPDFLNGCLQLDTLLDPEELLLFLHEVEEQANRTRPLRWGPRTLDLDILLYDRLVYESKDLLIPHADMQNRRFVLEPLAQLCPNYRHPLYGRTIRQMLQELKEETYINK